MSGQQGGETVDRIEIDGRTMSGEGRNYFELWEYPETYGGWNLKGCDMSSADFRSGAQVARQAARSRTRTKRSGC